MFKAIAYPLAALFAVASIGSPAMARNPVVGQPAPDATMRLVNGQVVRLSELKGQVVVINFWATWCGPCKQELPLLDTYYKLQKKHGLRVFAATTEDSIPLRYLNGLFAKMTIEPVRSMSSNYAPLTGVPTNFVIDRAGIVRYAGSGAFNLQMLNDLLVPLLREAPPAAATLAAADVGSAR